MFCSTENFALFGIAFIYLVIVSSVDYCAFPIQFHTLKQTFRSTSSIVLASQTFSFYFALEYYCYIENETHFERHYMCQ